VNYVSCLFSCELAIIHGCAHRGHGRNKILHAFNGRQLKIDWATAALGQQAIETIFEATNIAGLGKLDHFSTELFGLARDQLFDQAGGFVF
jgi:hypothetical protein